MVIKQDQSMKNVHNIKTSKNRRRMRSNNNVDGSNIDNDFNIDDSLASDY